MEKYTFIGYILPTSKMNRENIIQRMQTMKEVGNGDHKERKYIKTTAMSYTRTCSMVVRQHKGVRGGTAHPWARGTV